MITKEQAEEKLKDKSWRVSHLYKIKTKEQKIQTFKPNAAQRFYLEKETNRDIILKARQLGISTLKLIEQLDYATWNENSNVAVIAHTRDKVQVLFEIVKLAYENIPKPFKPRVSYDNRNELYFPDIRSKIYVATDTRGETVHNLHVSELAYLESAEQKMLGILESVPKNGIISFESTANGIGNYFYKTWNEDNEFEKHFLAWNLDPEYQEDTTKTIDELEEEYRQLQLIYTLTPEIREKLNLSKEQFQWYINKVKRHRDSTPQEYPSTPLEAFIASGKNVFHTRDILKHTPINPIERRYQNLLIWELPVTSYNYIIGCDPAEGIGNDNSVIEVLNAATGEQAAELAVNNMPPDDLATFLLDIAKYYNNAFVVIETNNHGRTVIDKIKRKYMNIYRREIFDKLSNTKTKALGWLTTVGNKHILVDNLEEAARTGDIRINSQAALEELKVFVKTDETNKKGYGAEYGMKDDRVIALGLALQGMRDQPKRRKVKSEAEIKMQEYMERKRLEKYFPNRKGEVNRLMRKKQWIRGISR